MSAPKRLRHIGHVTDTDGLVTAIGVDGGTVAVQTCGIARFTPEQAEEFAALFVRACWEASAQGGAT